MKQVSLFLGKESIAFQNTFISTTLFILPKALIVLSVTVISPLWILFIRLVELPWDVVSTVTEVHMMNKLVLKKEPKALQTVQFATVKEDL